MPIFSPQLDPQDDAVLEQKIAVRYVTTRTTLEPRVNGIREIFFDGTDYWYRVFANGAWRETKLDGTGFPTGLTQGDIFYVNASGQIARLAAGTDGQFLQTNGAGQNPEWADLTAGTIEADYTYGEQPAVGDLVGHIEALTDRDIVFQNSYVTNTVTGIGDIDTRSGYAMQFTMPYTLASSTAKIWIAKVGTPTYSIEFAIYNDDGGGTPLPSTIVSSRTLVAADVTTSLVEYDLTVGALTRGTKYWIGLKVTDFDAANYYTSYDRGTWLWYYRTATFNDSTSVWANNSNANMLRWRLVGTTVAGVWKVLDVPNNIHIQGGTLGIVKSVNTGAGTCRVVTGGLYTGSGFTAGTHYYASATSAGALATSGSVMVGYAISTTQLYIFPRKPIKKTFSSMISWGTDTLNTAFDVMIGFLPKKVSTALSGASYTYYGDNDNGGIKSSDADTVRADFFDSTDTTGATGQLVPSKYVGAFSGVSRGSNSGDLTGKMTFET